ASVFPGRGAASARAIAIYFGGGGFGLLMSAITIPPLLAMAGDRAWPKAWLLLGAMSAAASIAATLAARRVAAPAPVAAPVAWAKLPLLATFLAYACFAFGYTAYMTFIVAFMRDNGAGSVEIGLMWAMLGLATLAGPRIWSGPMSSWPPGFALAGVLATIGIGATLPVIVATPAVMIVSAALFGAFFMTPASVTAIVRTALPPVVWGEAVAAFTLMFALLQCFGPILTGLLADLTGDLEDGLSVSAAVLMAGAALALLQGLEARPRR
ncbi:MAG TPA: YbfB/YjiJ family MFS transporter, partial [Hyphomicrobiaceae bacterium]|nr:YbfB/YjiJ family MFS transporter [Hyphomicrobiaceae bacterium]